MQMYWQNKVDGPFIWTRKKRQIIYLLIDLFLFFRLVIYPYTSLCWYIFMCSPVFVVIMHHWRCGRKIFGSVKRGARLCIINNTDACKGLIIVYFDEMHEPTCVTHSHMPSLTAQPHLATAVKGSQLQLSVSKGKTGLFQTLINHQKCVAIMMTWSF
jgi:hypothetical protein